MKPPAANRRPPRRLHRIAGACLGLAWAAATALAQRHPMPAAPEGTIESGVPAFAILSPDAVGLSAPPTDLHLLPDGRLLVVAGAELALGDGLRWETFLRQPDTPAIDLVNIAVDTDGRIYAGIPGGFARIDFGPHSRWLYTRIADLPAEEPALAGRTMTRVAAVGAHWYWTSGTGALVRWRPGQPAVVLGYLGDSERIFRAQDRVFVSDPSSGTTFAIADNGLTPLDTPAERRLDRTIICATPLEDGTALVGTYSLGLCHFDGRELRPLATTGALAGRHRITDLCATDGGFFCAALDNAGLAFFDRTGRVVQMLDRTVDHRLARVRRLLHAPGGTIWALLGEDLARVAFPAPLSQFEALVPTGLAYAQLTRHEGELWLLAGGKAHRGQYDTDRRLVGFAVDSPAPFASAVHSAAGRLFCTTTAGLYWRDRSEWRLLDPAVRNGNLCPDPADPTRWLLVAHDSVGWLRLGPEPPRCSLHPVPGLGSPYSQLVHGDGAFWAELGAGRCARILPSPDGPPTVRILTRADGLLDGWVEVFEVDGRVRFNVAGSTLRYDPATDRVVPDLTFLPAAQRAPGLIGRPARDALGRLWVTTNQGICVLDAHHPAPPATAEPLPRGLRPTAFFPETHGVVWIQQRQRLLRVDPAIPRAAPAPLRALIAHVQLPASGRSWVAPGPALPDLDYADNSLVVRFLAPGHDLRQPVSFEVMLTGADDVWTDTGPAGLASFNHLKEGRYVLHVRSRVGETRGTAAALAFSVRPPWSRTPLAYTLYALAAVALLAGAAALWARITRREEARLSRLVADRTVELRVSEHRYRSLSEELEQRVQERTAALTASNRELEAFSYSISHDLRGPLRNIAGFADLLRRRLPAPVDPECERFTAVIATEAQRLRHLIDSLLAFSRLNHAPLQARRIVARALVEQVRAEFAPTLGKRTIEWAVAPLPDLYGDPALLRQVLADLIGNALKFTRRRPVARIEIGAPPAPAGETILFVRDNGVGFDPQYADKLFGVFQRLHHARDFEGSGIGLANVKRIVGRHGGRVWAESRPGEGATFYFSLPADPARPS